MAKFMFFIVILLASNNVKSGGCAEWPPKINKNFRKSDKVVLAEVVDVKKTKADFLEYRAHFKVIERFKGGEDSYGYAKFHPLSHSLRMSKGEKYLLFIRHDFNNHVSICTGSRQYREDDWKTIHKLRQLNSTIQRVGYGHHNRHHYRYR